MCDIPNKPAFLVEVLTRIYFQSETKEYVVEIVRCMGPGELQSVVPNERRNITCLKCFSASLSQAL
jgi:hypothetical protein